MRTEVRVKYIWQKYILICTLCTLKKNRLLCIGKIYDYYDYMTNIWQKK